VALDVAGAGEPALLDEAIAAGLASRLVTVEGLLAEPGRLARHGRNGRRSRQPGPRLVGGLFVGPDGYPRDWVLEPFFGHPALQGQLAPAIVGTLPWVLEWARRLIAESRVVPHER
jgi:hypothetical protein